MERIRIFILLSSKCSGSSALQYYLEENFGIGTLSQSGHFEKETLYWTKAASVLGLSQNKMHRSLVPYKPVVAMDLLRDFLALNNAGLENGPADKNTLFEGFYKAARNTSLNIIEKSPHHLFNISNLALILEFKEYIRNRADVIIVGLVRNPMDTIYSAWKRWNFNSDKFEQEWFQSYSNLEKLITDKSVEYVFRYEDIITDPAKLDNFLLDFGITKSKQTYALDSRSLSKWMSDANFRHVLQEGTKQLALRFGYTETQMQEVKKAEISWTLCQLWGDVKYFLRNLKNGFIK
jgi:hypothetical protein